MFPFSVALESTNVSVLMSPATIGTIFDLRAMMDVILSVNNNLHFSLCLFMVCNLTEEE